MPGLCRYSKKVADEYMWTQFLTTPQRCPPIPPNDAQNTPKDLLLKAPRKDFKSSGAM